MGPFDLNAYMEEKRSQVNRLLEEVLASPRDEDGLYAAMRYSVFAGGKRLRPILALAGAEAVGGVPEKALPFAAALELIHTYSLVHDDLPAMDDSDFRRGRPTSHKQFGEATAVLTGDALLTLAFEVMTAPGPADGPDPRVLQRVVCEVARAIGVAGMIGGQAADLRFMGKRAAPRDVEYIHSHKTGALIRVSAWGGAVLGDGSPEQVEAVGRYGKNVGLAFQIVDDILDEVGDSDKMGKSAGSDQEAKKATYLKVFGIEESRRRAKGLVDAALAEVSGLGPGADPLRQIAQFIVARDF
ncbi:MAG: polyprenyl synthetase family protein [Candidatus Tectomicrobia bacterium]|nr:polyprenyl synthetase family protein [Candidatus Tectomicrobia bacterium]